MNTITSHQSPADPRLEISPQRQNGDTQKTDVDDDQTRKIYHFENCGTVYVDSLNTRTVTMENCGNRTVQQVTYRHPRIIGCEESDKILHSQSHAVFNALGPKTSTGPPTNPFLPTQMWPNPHIYTSVSTAVQRNHPGDVPLQTNAQSRLCPAQSLRPISPSHFSGDNIHRNLKYLEKLLNSHFKLATVVVIRFSGNTSADILTPRAYDTLYTLAALHALVVLASTKHTVPGGDIPTHSAFSDLNVRNDYPSGNPDQSPRLPNSGLVAPLTCRVHLSISVDYVVLFSWAGLTASVCCLAFFAASALRYWGKDPF